jgi:viroplasmin and RNaseH domain-containing protein
MGKNKTKFYAIKEGKGVSNLIVTTWDECSKLVLGYNSVYKSFKTREEAEKYLGSVNVQEVKEKTIKGMEARKSKKKKGKPITIRLETDLYLEFENRCTRLDTEQEKIIEDLIKEWLE